MKTINKLGGFTARYYPHICAIQIISFLIATLVVMPNAPYRDLTHLLTTISGITITVLLTISLATAILQTILLICVVSKIKEWNNEQRELQNELNHLNNF